MAAPPYALDTNILVHGVRRSPLWGRVQARYRLLVAEPTPLVSVVSVGELRAVAPLREWGPARVDQMEFILSCFTAVPVGGVDLVGTYARFAAAAVRDGHAIGQNDLWIAATAAAAGATLLTTDRDFDWLSPDRLTVRWIDPADPAP